MKSPAAIIFLATVLLAAGTQAAPKASGLPTPLPTPTEAEWRTPDPQDVLVIDTTKGRIIVEMSPLATPLTVARIRTLTRAGLYNGRGFFRVIDNFMDQTGDPQDNGTGGSKEPNLPPEFTFRRGADTPLAAVSKEGGVETGLIGAFPVASQTLDLALLTVDQKVNAWGMFCPGVVGMARSDAPDSANSQFFLMRATTASLDQKYTAFGRAIAGFDVIRAIKVGEPPTDPDRMTTVRILADIPVAEQPKIRVADTRGAWFKSAVDRARVQKVVGVSACDVDIPVEVK